MLGEVIHRATTFMPDQSALAYSGEGMTFTMHENQGGPGDPSDSRFNRGPSGWGRNETGEIIFNQCGQPKQIARECDNKRKKGSVAKEDMNISKKEKGTDWVQQAQWLVRIGTTSKMKSRGMIRMLWHMPYGMSWMGQAAGITSHSKYGKGVVGQPVHSWHLNCCQTSRKLRTVSESTPIQRH